MCGEHRQRSALLDRHRGSSPRVRGTLTPILFGSVHTGIIPACAGNTDFPTFMAVNNGDHPRVCGEHPVTLLHIDLRPGSSPRVRGTHVL